MEPRLIKAVRQGLSETGCSLPKKKKEKSIDHALHKCLKQIDFVRNCLSGPIEKMPWHLGAKCQNMFSNSHCCCFKYLPYESSITLFTSLLHNLLHTSLGLSSAHISEAKPQITFKHFLNPELNTTNEILNICMLTSFDQICLVSWFDSTDKWMREMLNVEARQCSVT